MVYVEDYVNHNENVQLDFLNLIGNITGFYLQNHMWLS